MQRQPEDVTVMSAEENWLRERFPWPPDATELPPPAIKSDKWVGGGLALDLVAGILGGGAIVVGFLLLGWATVEMTAYWAL